MNPKNIINAEKVTIILFVAVRKNTESDLEYRNGHRIGQRIPKRPPNRPDNTETATESAREYRIGLLFQYPCNLNDIT